MSYDHKKLQDKWGKLWEEQGVYEVDLEKARKPFYNLTMFPYPSAEGMHVGNAYTFTGSDTYGRYMRMKGFDVFEPIGLDGFGIHSENYAMKVGRRPEEHARISEKNFYRQLASIGNGFSWNHKLETYDPEYYKWTQWLFIKMFEAGLAYKKEAKVNWCPSCKTVLADEQAEAGECERCKTEVKRKKMSSWHFRITKYAERLLGNIDGSKGKVRENKVGAVDEGYDVQKDGLRWPKKIKTAQRNWIGKKEGIEIKYEVLGLDETITCFTTTPVNWGATFVVLAPEHELVEKIIKGKVKVTSEIKSEVSLYVEKALSKSEQQRKKDEGEKTGVFTGLYVLNQVNDKKIPVWVSDFVLAGVGTGAVQGCPGHDMRDFEFASKFKIPIVRVVKGEDGDESEIDSADKVIQAGSEGVMVNSDFLNGVDFTEAMEKTMDYFEKKGWGKRTVSYHLRDWLISRQRYWGAPIPMVECKKCGWQPVPEASLPVLLPEIEDFKPKGDGSSPLDNAPEDWKTTSCPKCKGEAKRELDVCDTFLDSSWYFLGYLFIKKGKWDEKGKPFREEILNKWMPVSSYIGGAEHAVLHLLYARFVAMALKDLGYLKQEEPFPFLFSQGMIIKDGAKMSKSKGNVVVPDEYIEKYGADSLRCYLMFMGSFDSGGDFRDTGMIGMYKFVKRVWGLFTNKERIGEKTDVSLEKQLHRTIKKVGEDMEVLKFNTAIASMMEFVNEWKKEGVKLSESDALSFLKLLAPFCPYMSEELYQKVFRKDGKGSIHVSSWPEFSKEKVKQDRVEIAIQVNGKLRDAIGFTTDEAKNRTKVIVTALKSEKIRKWVGKRKDYKVIFVPGRLVNFVI
jgi:leucyl-tRNA synthetase